MARALGSNENTLELVPLCPTANFCEDVIPCNLTTGVTESLVKGIEHRIKHWQRKFSRLGDSTGWWTENRRQPCSYQADQSLDEI